MRNVRYLIMITILLLACFVLTSCEKQESQQTPGTEPFSQAALDEDISQLLANEQLSNFEKISALENLTDAQLQEAERYRSLIKQTFKETVEDATKIFNDAGFSLNDAERSIDSYCDYLKNEYEMNKEFFENCAAVKYQQGTAGSTYQARKRYECARNYAEKLESLYADLINSYK